MKWQYDLSHILQSSAIFSIEKRVEIEVSPCMRRLPQRLYRLSAL